MTIEVDTMLAVIPTVDNADGLCTSRTAPALLLHRWAPYRAIGAINAAVSGLWTEQGFAVFAFVKELASISWHGFQL